jgi:hypothetical protein
LRLSAASTSTLPAAPPRTRATACDIADNAARCEPPVSTASMSSASVNAPATTPAFSRSANGSVSEARNTARTWRRSSAGPRQSRAAATAIVMLSSSQCAIARVPLRDANCGAYQAFACPTAWRESRRRGT